MDYSISSNRLKGSLYVIFCYMLTHLFFNDFPYPNVLYRLYSHIHQVLRFVIIFILLYLFIYTQVSLEYFRHLVIIIFRYIYLCIQYSCILKYPVIDKFGLIEYLFFKQLLETRKQNVKNK